MRIVNLCPHAITIRLAGGTDRVIEPTKPAARVDSEPGQPLEAFDGVPCNAAPVWGEVLGLPAPAPDTIYVVSALVAARVSRPDVFCPGTGPKDQSVREPDLLPNGEPNPKKGQIQAVTRLIRTC